MRIWNTKCDRELCSFRLVSPVAVGPPAVSEHGPAERDGAVPTTLGRGALEQRHERFLAGDGLLAQPGHDDLALGATVIEPLEPAGDALACAPFTVRSSFLSLAAVEAPAASRS